MRNAGEAKCCLRCGRWGNRAFVRNWTHEGWECANDRACAERVEHNEAEELDHIERVLHSFSE